jgi:hypothetical protein
MSSDKGWLFAALPIWLNNYVIRLDFSTEMVHDNLQRIFVAIASYQDGVSLPAAFVSEVLAHHPRIIRIFLIC